MKYYVCAYLINNFLIGKSLEEGWTSYGMESCGLSSSIIPYASVASVYCLLMELITNFLWLFGDWLLLLVSLIMAHMFRRINVNGIQRIEPGRLSSIEIDLVREHHGLMSKLVKVSIPEVRIDRQKYSYVE